MLLLLVFLVITVYLAYIIMQLLETARRVTVCIACRGLVRLVSSACPKDDVAVTMCSSAVQCCPVSQVTGFVVSVRIVALSSSKSMC
jgi:hypothetical protein